MSAEGRRAALEGALAQMIETEGPIVVGPWVSEVGYEVLYWIPFLRKLIERDGLDPARVVAISRGGVASWYTGIAASYFDVLDLMTATEFREMMAESWAAAGGQKQDAMGAAEARVISALMESEGWERTPAIIHPELLFRILTRSWKDDLPLSYVLDQLAFRRWPRPHDEEMEQLLPSGPYVAVKFYFRPSFPDTPTNRELAQRVVDVLSSRTKVVSLATQLEIDDHREFDPDGPEILRPLVNVEASRNLHAQSVVIASSRALIGTYGGLSYVAPSFGVPSLALSSHPKHYFPAHLDLARRAAADCGASIVALDGPRFDALAVFAMLA